MREISCHDPKAAAPFRGLPRVYDREPPIVHISENPWKTARFLSSRPGIVRGPVTRLMACLFMATVGGLVGLTMGFYLMGRPDGALLMSSIYVMGHDDAIFAVIGGFVLAGASFGLSMVLTRWTRYDEKASAPCRREKAPHAVVRFHPRRLFQAA